MKKRFLSFWYAIEGLVYLIRTQVNAQIHFLAAIIVSVVSLYFKISNLEWAILFLTFGLVIATEALNTSIEVICDKIFPEIDPKAKIIKDVAAAAVLFSALMAVLIGGMIFGWRLLDFLSS